MERVQELIDKLWKQHQQQEGPERLLATVQHLQELLTTMVRSEAAQASGKVAVVLPPKRRTTVEVVTPKTPPVQQEIQQRSIAVAPAPAVSTQQESPVAPIENPEVKAPIPAAIEPHVPVNDEAHPVSKEPEPPKQPYTINRPPVAEWAVTAPPEAPMPVKSEESESREIFHLHIDTPEDAPTLMQQYTQPPKELHEVIRENKESLNDRLKQDKPELGHKLKETPIKDLRKAIGLNDKFLFIKELFRGDEAMYERSIKTINNFHILQEAEYWISRELKVKLGWEDSRDVVQAFYQLVKRRFS